MKSRRPGEGRYAHVEREQRWLLDSLPSGVMDERTIIDHYLTGTTLRLRMIEGPSDAVFKLGQKIRVEDSEPETVLLTNVYLTANEFDQLSVLPSSVIAKSRWNFDHEGVTFAVDEFKGRHVGLVMAEVEIGVGDTPLACPAFATVEVTGRNEFSGGWLAEAPDEDVRRLLDGSIPMGDVV